MSKNNNSLVSEKGGSTLDNNDKNNKVEESNAQKFPYILRNALFKPETDFGRIRAHFGDKTGEILRFAVAFDSSVQIEDFYDPKLKANKKTTKFHSAWYNLPMIPNENKQLGVETGTYVKMNRKEKTAKVAVEYHATAIDFLSKYVYQVTFGTLKDVPLALGVKEIKIVGEINKNRKDSDTKKETQVTGIEKLLNSKTGTLDRLLREQNKEDRVLTEKLEKFTLNSIQLMLKKEAPFVREGPGPSSSA